MHTNQTALLVMDVQNGIVQRYAEKPAVMASFQRAVGAARHAEIPVIFVSVAFRDGYPEVSAKNKAFSADPEVHRVLMEKVFPRQADVVTVDAWVASISNFKNNPAVK